MAASDDPSMVRPYTITGGRADTNVHLAYETMLQATPTARIEAVKFERAAILRLCATEAQSVVELAARLHLPIGVVRVVAGDLLAEGRLQAHQPSGNLADDVALITRLIAGVRAL